MLSKRKFLFISGIALTFLSSSAASTLQRQPFRKPAIITLEAREWMTKIYLGSLDDLRAQDLPEEPADIAEQLDKTLDQASLLQAIERLRSSLSNHPEATREAIELAITLSRLIENGDYLQPGKYPVTLTYDPETRKYEAKWRTRNADFKWLGPLKRISISAVPLLEVLVESRFDPDRDGYGYTICNDANSVAPAEYLGVRAVGLNQNRIEMLNEWDKKNRTSTSVAGRVDIFYPDEGYLQEFYLWPRVNDGTLKSVQPGDCLTIPEVLDVPWPSLPGIVPAWIKPGGYRPEVSAHRHSEALAFLFTNYEFEQTPAGRKKTPRRFYEGRVLGPVPVPEPGASAESFARRLLEEDWKTAEEWGWTAESERVDEFEKRLSCILDADSRKACTPELLLQTQKLESAGLILPELGILLRENLNYLSDESNW